MSARIIWLELQHAAAAIERAWLISRGGELARLLEAARATLDLANNAKENRRLRSPQ